MPRGRGCVWWGVIVLVGMTFGGLFGALGWVWLARGILAPTAVMLLVGIVLFISQVLSQKLAEEHVRSAAFDLEGLVVERGQLTVYDPVSLLEYVEVKGVPNSRYSVHVDQRLIDSLVTNVELSLTNSGSEEYERTDEFDLLVERSELR